MSEDNPPIDEIIEAKMLPVLIECLASNNTEFKSYVTTLTDGTVIPYQSLIFLQSKAACALANITCGSYLQTKAVVEAGLFIKKIQGF